MQGHDLFFRSRIDKLLVVSDSSHYLNMFGFSGYLNFNILAFCPWEDEKKITGESPEIRWVSFCRIWWLAKDPERGVRWWTWLLGLFWCQIWVVSGSFMVELIWLNDKLEFFRTEKIGFLCLIVAGRWWGLQTVYLTKTLGHKSFCGSKAAKGGTWQPQTVGFRVDLWWI